MASFTVGSVEISSDSSFAVTTGGFTVSLGRTTGLTFTMGSGTTTVSTSGATTVSVVTFSVAMVDSFSAGTGVSALSSVLSVSRSNVKTVGCLLEISVIDGIPSA